MCLHQCNKKKETVIYSKNKKSLMKFNFVQKMSTHKEIFSHALVKHYFFNEPYSFVFMLIIPYHFRKLDNTILKKKPYS